MKSYLGVFDRLNLYIVKIEKVVVCICVLSMIAMASGQVVLRNTISMGILWIEHLTRILILWVTFLGASLASDQGNHICMDLVTRYVSENRRKIFETLSSLIVITCCSLLFLISLKYLEIQRMNQASNFWPGSPDWIYLVVIPYFFFITVFRSILYIKNIYVNDD